MPSDPEERASPWWGPRSCLFAFLTSGVLALTRADSTFARRRLGFPHEDLERSAGLCEAVQRESLSEQVVMARVELIDLNLSLR